MHPDTMVLLVCLHASHKIVSTSIHTLMDMYAYQSPNWPVNGLLVLSKNET